MKRRLLLIAGWTAFTLSLGIILGDCGREGHNKAIRIGVSLPLSGGMAEYGQNGKEGLILATEEFNNSHTTGPRVTLIFQDDEGTPTGTVTAVHRLIDVEGTKYIIGGLTSSGVLAAAPYAQEKGVLFFSPAASAPGIPEIGDMVFRNWQSDALLGSMYGKAAYERLHLRNVAIIHVSNDYGTNNKMYFSSAFVECGGTIGYTRAYPQGETDYRTLVTQMRNSKNVDGFLIVGYPDEYKGLFQEIASQGGLRTPVLTTDTFFDPSLLAELGGSAEGVYCAVAAKPSAEYAPRRKFIAAYRDRFKASTGEPKDPGLVSDTAYDALRLVADAITQTTGSPTDVSAWLLKVRDYPGASGPTTFTATGDIGGAISLYRVANKQFVEVPG